jgi:AcrR family transcriptional regulator
MPRTAHTGERVTPRKSPVQERSRQSVRAILEGAAQVLEQRGYAGTNTDRIAERAGVSVGTLYQYFPNKDSIVMALAFCHAVEGAIALAPLAHEFRERPPPIEEGVRRLVHACTATHSRPRLHQVLFAETAIPVETQERFKRDSEAVAQELARYLERAPGVKVRDPLLAAHFVLETMASLLHRLVIEPPTGYDEAECEAETVAVLVGYLTTSSKRC